MMLDKVYMLILLKMGHIQTSSIWQVINISFLLKQPKKHS